MLVTSSGSYARIANNVIVRFFVVYLLDQHLVHLLLTHISSDLMVTRKITLNELKYISNVLSRVNIRHIYALSVCVSSFFVLNLFLVKKVYS